MKRQARAFSPGSVGNIGVGFDILGHPLAGIGDTATVRAIDAPTVRIAAVRGVCADEVPLKPTRNTAGTALIALRTALALPFGFELELDKGLPLAAGMGGSAASCVAALLAANALLDEPLSIDALYPHALTGESVASGGRNGDNVGPMLAGGLVLATADRLVRIAVPEAWHCALVHPQARLQTLASRRALAGSYALADVVAQTAGLGQLLLGCERGDPGLVRAGLRDVLIEPRRAPLIPGFAQARQAALERGALGASISGAGPSLFAWCENEATALVVAQAMADAFAARGLSSNRYVGPIAAPAARVLD